MSDRARSILISVMVIFMAFFAFTAGFLTNDFIEQQTAQAEPVSDEGFELFWEAWGKIEDNFLGDIPEQKQVAYGAVRGALRQLNDPYTIFLEPVVRQEEKQNLRGNFGGIGVNLSRNEAGELILDLIVGNPAEKAGILSGDVLLAVDGEAISAEESIQAIAERIRGEKGTDVVLTVLHPDETDATDVSVERGDILIPSVSSKLLRDDPTIGYIQLMRFSGESGNEIEAAIDSLLEEGATRFIFDLRNNGGGLLDAAVAVSDNFLMNEVVYHQISRGEDEKSESTDRATILPDAPLVVLVNGGTASSAEIVAGALQDHERAILIGETTFGKGSVQLVYDLSDKSSIHVTWARWLTPERRQIDQNGLPPDIEVTLSQEALENGRDEPLERAIQHLQTIN